MTDSSSYDLAAEYSGKASAYARGWSPPLRRLARPLIDALPLEGARRVLDVGAGTGTLLSDLAAAAPRALVIGVDFAIGMLRQVGRSERIVLAAADARRLAIRPATIDVAVSSFAFQHMKDPVAAVREIAGTLARGGTFGLATWGREHAVPTSDIWAEELDRAGAGPDPRSASVVHHDQVDSPAKIEAIMRAAGLQTVRSWLHIGREPWRRDDLVDVQSACCSPTRRLAQLEPEARAACIDAVRRRVASLGDHDLLYEPEVVLTIARPG